MKLLRTPNLNSSSTSQFDFVLCLSLHHGYSPEGIKILQVLVRPWLSLLLHTVMDGVVESMWQDLVWSLYKLLVSYLKFKHYRKIQCGRWKCL